MNESFNKNIDFEKKSLKEIDRERTLSESKKNIEDLK
jgi:hypothetical protein